MTDTASAVLLRQIRLERRPEVGIIGDEHAFL